MNHILLFCERSKRGLSNYKLKINIYRKKINLQLSKIWFMFAFWILLHEPFSII
ncbi:MAG: hypothetical protein U5L45_07130 [Saprospiraceae bacterium]|nr:hypothetical protein [Saprospiraceae bacterium]